MKSGNGYIEFVRIVKNKYCGLNPEWKRNQSHFESVYRMRDYTVWWSILFSPTKNKCDENEWFDELSLLDPTRYILWSGKWWMFVDGMVHETLMNDGYKCKEDWDVDMKEIGKSFSYMRMMK